MTINTGATPPNPVIYRTGRLPATRPEGLKDMVEYAPEGIQDPPAEITKPTIELPIDGNAQYGDCTFAGLDHFTRIQRALYGPTGRIPTEQELIAKYLEVSPNDEGCNEAELLRRWRTVGLGLFGGQPRAYVPVGPKAQTQIKQSIAFTGACYFGVIVGRPQQEQFQANEPWSWVEGQEEDGHCILGVAYDDGGVWSGTWGGLAYTSWEFLDRSLEEAWCILSHQLLEAGHDGFGLDVPTLEADLPQI